MHNGGQCLKTIRVFKTFFDTLHNKFEPFDVRVVFECIYAEIYT